MQKITQKRPLVTILKTMKFLKTLLILTMLAIGGYFAYQYFYTDNANQQVHYITEDAQLGRIDKSVLATGSIRAYQRIEVGAQVSGKIQRIYVTLGQKVKKGELLAEIDSSNQQNQLETAQAQLAVYQAQLKSHQVALNVAESNYHRLNKLYQQKSASLNDLESAQNTLATARASVDQSKAQIRSAEISVNDAQVNVGYTKITSPIDGVIVSIPVSEGQTANSNQTSPTIVQVADLSKVLIKLEISEGDIAQVHENQKVTFSTLAAPNRIYEGKIGSVDPALTTLTDNTYNDTSGNSSAIYYYANVVIDNSDNSLRIGMTTQGRVIIAEKNDVLLAPTTAIKKRNNRNVLEVLEDNKVIEKEVQLGLSDSQNTEIISGLNKGDKIITAQRSSNEKVGNSNMRMPRF